MFNFKAKVLFISSVLFLSGCASGKFKERQEQREKVSATTGMFCEFVSGDIYPDLDVELNLRMAQRCDAGKNFSIANYKNSSDQAGVIYCCSNGGRSERSSISVPLKQTSAPAPTQNKSAVPKPEGKTTGNSDENAD